MKNLDKYRFPVNMSLVHTRPKIDRLPVVNTHNPTVSSPEMALEMINAGALGLLPSGPERYDLEGWAKAATEEQKAYCFAGLSIDFDTKIEAELEKAVTLAKHGISAFFVHSNIGLSALPNFLLKLDRLFKERSLVKPQFFVGPIRALHEVLWLNDTLGSRFDLIYNLSEDSFESPSPSILDLADHLRGRFLFTIEYSGASGCDIAKLLGIGAEMVVLTNSMESCKESHPELLQQSDGRMYKRYENGKSVVIDMVVGNLIASIREKIAFTVGIAGRKSLDSFVQAGIIRA